ncbi:GAF domain-containing protein [Sphingomonas silueang]|uniref:GAF domain-containing protein n=1 Tax=Sphingomonas silueang TaxID=3156617 RepID=UPI0032B5DE09
MHSGLPDPRLDSLPRRHLRLLGDAADRLLAADDPATMVRDLFALIADELRLDLFINYRLDGDELRLDAHGGLDAAQAAALDRLALGQAVCGRVARDGHPIEAFSIQASDAEMTDTVRGLGVDAYACTPLIHGSTLMGTLSFGRRWTDRFDADELALLRTLCHYVALAKYRLRVEAELREGIATRERLLGELNHRVRNALQTAVAVVRLGMADSADAGVRDALALAAGRLEVLAAAHRPLYATATPTRIDLAALLGSLVDQDGSPWTGDTPPPALPVEQAAAAAMLVQALLPADADATLTIGQAGTRLDLRLQAPGLGAAQPAIDDSRLVRALLRQLRAELARDGADALAVTLAAHG